MSRFIGSAVIEKAALLRSRGTEHAATRAKAVKTVGEGTQAEWSGAETMAANKAYLARWSRRALQELGPWMAPVILLVIWQALADLGRLSGTLPSPAGVWRSFWALATQGALLSDILISLRRVTIGFVLGAGTGLVLGFLSGLSLTARLLFDRTLQMVRTIPHLALVPLMIFWFGIGEEPRILLVALGTLFPVYINTFSGIRAVDPKLVELGRSYGLNRVQLVWSIVLPGALQPILVGIRYSLGVAFLTLVVAETIASRDGIGYLVQNAREMLRLDIIVLAIVLYAIAGWLADLLTRAIERRVLRWHPNYASQDKP